VPAGQWLARKGPSSGAVSRLRHNPEGFTSFALELLVYPAVYLLWKGRGLADGPATAEPVSEPGRVSATA
jgi:hypothetical protein